jgi:hypothetical protein
MKIEDYEEQINSSVNVVFWNRLADTITETLDGARESEEFETIKERGSKFIEVLLADYKEEDIKNEKEREAFIRLRDITKKY